MLFRLKELSGAVLQARNGEAGKLKDVYFGDGDRKIRYLVMDTGGWFTGRKILISPVAIESIDREQETIQTNLTKEQIESSPPIGAKEPISRRMEVAISRHYGWPSYWEVTTPTLDTLVLTPSTHQARTHVASETRASTTANDHELRSANEVEGYGIGTTDGSIGHVDDFVCDSADWSIRYLVVGTRRILPGRKVLIPPFLIDKVSWSERSVRLRVTEAQIRSAPDFGDEAPIDEQGAASLDHFGRNEAHSTIRN